MMPRRAITFDLDDTIFRSCDAIAGFLAARGIAPNTADFGYKWLDPSVREELFGFFSQPGFCTGGLTSPNIPAYIETLRRDYDVFFVTWRPKVLFDATRAQFAECGLDFDERSVIFCGPLADKAGVLKDIGTTLHVDDGPAAIETCVENGINHLMISNECTKFNWYLRDDPRVRWVENPDQFWDARDRFINYKP